MGLLVNTLAADENYLVLHRDNLKIPIQMQSSQEEKKFSQFFAAFLESRLNFKHFENEDDPHRFFVLEVRTPKTYSDKCLKSPVSEDASRSNMSNLPKHC